MAKYITRQFRLTKSGRDTALAGLRKRQPFRKHTSSPVFRTKRGGKKVSGGYYIYSYKK